MKDPRLASLIDMYLAGVISADELVELREYLVSSARARRQFDRHVSWYEIIHPGVPLPTAERFLEDAAVAQSRADELLLVSVCENAAETLRGWIASWRGWSAGGALAVCAAVGCVLAWRYQAAPLPPFEPPAITDALAVATLRHAAGVQWLGITNEVFVGDSLNAGRLRIASGAMELQFKRGATLVVEGPADVQLISDNAAFLHSGKVTAHVPKQAQGFKVTAPHVAVTDLGTEFGLSAMSNAPAEVHVFSGVVEMARRTADAKTLTQGQGARVQGKRVRNMTADRSAFLFEEEVVEREAAEQRETYRVWKNAALELSNDRATLIHYTFEDQTADVRKLANHATKTPLSANGTIGGCKWTEGRWPEKHALAFGGKSDRVRFSVPNALTSLTYMVWVQMDNLLSVSNALAITDSTDLGAVHWQVYRDGRVALSAKSGSAGSIDQTWDRGLSPAVFTADRLGKWTHLVSVYDSGAKTIRHYVNGEFISATPIKRPLPLKLSGVEIGNWGVRGDESKNNTDYYNRFWKGRIDEFALMARALTQEEIQRYYQRGRVSAGVVVADATP
jgi:hypothetical protein